MDNLCPTCSLELKVRMSPTLKVVNDDTAGKETEVYQVQELYCENKKCSNYGKVVKTIEHKLK